MKLSLFLKIKMLLAVKRHVITILKDICRSRAVKTNMSSSDTTFFQLMFSRVQVLRELTTRYKLRIPNEED